MKKLSKLAEELEIFKKNEELGQLLDCRLDLTEISYQDFKDGNYDERIAELLDEDLLFTDHLDENDNQ